MTLRITTQRKWGAPGRLLIGLLLLLTGPAAIAKLTLTGVTNVNVTPSTFSVVGNCSSPLDSATTVTVSVFADAAGVTNLAGQLGVEFYPLCTGNPAATNSYDRRLNEAALRQDSMNFGLVYARVSGCSPNTVYYYSVQVAQTNGQQAIWPASGPLPAVTTPPENAFVLDSQQLVLTLDEASPSGAIVLLSNTNTPSILAAVVGDSAGTNQAFFSINELLAAAGNTNSLPTGTQQFTATVFGLPGGTVAESYTLSFTTNFLTAQSSNLSLIPIFTILSLGSTAALSGTGGTLPLTLDSSVAVTGFSVVLGLPVTLFSELLVETDTSLLRPVSIRVPDAGTLQIGFAAPAGQSFVGNEQIAHLSFTVSPNLSSRFVGLSPRSFWATNTGSLLLSNTVANPGRVAIIGSQPLLDSSVNSGSRLLTLYGIPGKSYQIQSSTALNHPQAWLNSVRIPMTNLSIVIPNIDPAPPAIFYRAYELNTTTPILDPQGANQMMVLYGAPGASYEILYTTSLLAPWRVLTLVPMTSSFAFVQGLSGAGPDLFYRAELLRADPPILQAYLSGQTRSLLAYGLPQTNYTLLYSTNLLRATNWHPLLQYTLSNSFQWFTGLGNTNPAIFYRLQRH